MKYKKFGTGTAWWSLDSKTDWIL